MKAMFRKIGLLAALAICAITAAQATPVTYDFTASGFTANSGHAVPNSSLAGSMTIDGTTVTGIDLTIGSHTYTAAEVGFVSSWIGGGLACGVQCITWGTDDFWLVGTFSDTPSFSNFAYSVSGVSDIFESNTGTLTVDVPEPTSIALFFLGLFALGFALRKKA